MREFIKDADTPELERLRDPAYLPGRQEIFDAFGGELGTDFLQFCFDGRYPIFEFFNREHLQALGGYLAGRAHALGARAEQPLTIVEVGAGTGRLSHFLGQILLAREVPAKVVATDANPKKELNPYGLEAHFPVEPMTYKEAMQFYEPDIVLSSWMPYCEDWTPTFRAAPSVHEYILMGETDGGCVASDETWGVPPYDADYEVQEKYVAEYERDGFTREDLAVVSLFQVCRTDFGDAQDFYQHSRTVSFKRTGISTIE